VSGFSYIAALVATNFKTHLLGFERTLLLGGMMFVQNLFFFLLWAVFFSSVSNIRGWQMEQVGILFGFCSMSYGLSLFLCDGPRNLARAIVDRSFDGYLTRPRHPLPAVLLSKSNASSLGDMMSGPFYWYFFGHLNGLEILGAMALAVLVAILITATQVVFYSVAFWMKSNEKLSDQLFEMLIIFSCAPQPGQSIGVKFLMFTVLPAGFIGYLPVTLLGKFDSAVLAAMGLATLGYVLFAIFFFDRGVQRYLRG
jgi:ABC-2 type transport system permease protein